MADNTHIEWTDATWNPITGCSVVSSGCTNCYAMRLAGGRLKHTASRQGLTTPSKAGPVWNGQVRFNAGELVKPLSWRRPRKIFVCAHGDLFHEAVPDAWIDQVFAVMALSPQHTFQVLTKRAARMRAYLSTGRAHPVGLAAMEQTLIGMARDPRSRVGAGVMLQGDIAHLSVWPLPNVWLGVSAEDQARADERIPDLLATPAAARFLSAEPLLGPIDLNLAGMKWNGKLDRQTGERRFLDWVIAGGESGPGARPMHPDWPRQIRDACAAAGVPFFFKQWGAWKHVEVVEGPVHDPRHIRYMAADGVGGAALETREEVCGETDETAWYFANVGKKAAGRRLDGVEHNAMPGHLS